ncbi:hypothetical protein ACFOLJ_16965 [Rugamonas sp. CCM 8940]|uniref:hypothetical protein n=1 Tax=Rugamonas sp. CCM 8940 TaxID=2765359 RepID=UPI0018F61E3B|nr:hypothetical protein [Rugamonas sp. CCM 8940]MBJ7311079.1 hypothetical protein [Rugamonas sp. CCM 8940]
MADSGGGVGSEAACADLPSPQAARTAQQRQALVVCRDIELVRRVATFIHQGSAQLEKGGSSDRQISEVLRQELLSVRDDMRTTRGLLENLKLRGGDGLLLTPSRWVRDLNGDGRIATWERNFFAIPKPHDGPLTVGLASDDPGYYRDEYRLDASFKVDQSDVTWALGYHYFAEAVVEMVLAYTLEGESYSSGAIVLFDPAAAKRAHALLVAGFKSTERLRRALLAETDDAAEWIANPRQRNSVFPLRLDEGDFAVWGEVLKQVIPLMEGKTLLVPAAKQGGMLGSLGGLCPAGQGLNVVRLFQQPPRRLLSWGGPEQQARMCQRVDAGHPKSALFELLASYDQRAGNDSVAGMRMLRQLLWVN